MSLKDDGAEIADGGFFLGGVERDLGVFRDQAVDGPRVFFGEHLETEGVLVGQRFERFERGVHFLRIAGLFEVGEETGVLAKRAYSGEVFE